MKNIEFINAGAGSGKTHRLVTLLAGYLSGEGEKYKPGEVFLTTFTELAAAEFREKAREALLTPECTKKHPSSKQPRLALFTQLPTDL